jgi:hypothetical protein
MWSSKYGYDPTYQLAWLFTLICTKFNKHIISILLACIASRSIQHYLEKYLYGRKTILGPIDYEHCVYWTAAAFKFPHFLKGSGPRTSEV